VLSVKDYDSGCFVCWVISAWFRIKDPGYMLRVHGLGIKDRFQGSGFRF
jgi:hypothetical protein